MVLGGDKMKARENRCPVCGSVGFRGVVWFYCSSPACQNYEGLDSAIESIDSADPSEFDDSKTTKKIQSVWCWSSCDDGWD